jgi:SAM-dependent methyltransferase
VLHGTDRNPLRLARAAATGACLARASLLALPYPRHGFDAVLCNHVIEHIPEHAAALAELRRVLRPGGLLIVGVPNEGCALARLRNHVLQRRTLATTDHVHFFTAASLSRALVAAGFVAPAIAVEEFFWPHMALARRVQAHAAGRTLSRALGRMWDALDLALVPLAEDGMLFIALYNDQGWISRYWTWVKRIYNTGAAGRMAMIALHAPYLIGARLLARALTGRLQIERGMTYWYDMLDWLGGFPFEVASRSRRGDRHRRIKTNSLQPWRRPHSVCLRRCRPRVR